MAMSRITKLFAALAVFTLLFGVVARFDVPSAEAQTEPLLICEGINGFENEVLTIKTNLVLDPYVTYLAVKFDVGEELLPGYSATSADGMITATLSADGKFVTIEVNGAGVAGVFVKGGTCGFLYTSSTVGLPAPEGKEISHVTIIYFEVVEEVFEGLTPGFWKNNLDKWGASAWVGYAPTDLVPGTSLTFADALAMTGKDIYLAHLAAAYLNLAHPEIDYGLTADQIAAADLDTLDYFNNMGGGVDQQGNPL
jgi:hypothetical protein